MLSLSIITGLGPALAYQCVMNGIRLGSYQVILNSGITKNKDGNQNGMKCVLAGCFAGMCGAFVGSPIYMVSTIKSIKSYVIYI